MKDKKGANNEPRQLYESKLIRQLEKTAWTIIKTVVDTTPTPFLILDSKLRVVAANKYFYRVFQVSPEETEHQLVYNLGGGEWNIPELKKLLEKILPEKTYFKDFEVAHVFPRIGKKIMLLNARQIYEPAISHTVSIPMILLIIEDITVKKELEKKIANYTKQLEGKVAERTVELTDRVKELESLNKTMVGRELKMVELKKEIENLKKQFKK